MSETFKNRDIRDIAHNLIQEGTFEPVQFNILADALEYAGFENQRVIENLRTPEVQHHLKQ